MNSNYKTYYIYVLPTPLHRVNTPTDNDNNKTIKKLQNNIVNAWTEKIMCGQS